MHMYNSMASSTTVSTKQQLAITFFNETVVQFIEDLLLIYKKDPILLVAQGAVKLYLKGSSLGIHLAFEKCFGPYYEEIKARDERFFLDHTTAEYKLDYKRMKDESAIMQDIKRVKEQYTGDAAPAVGGAAARVIAASGTSAASEAAPGLAGQAGPKKGKEKSVFDEIVTKLKTEWSQMLPDNKKVIWEYCSQLCVLSERARAAA